MIKYILAYKNKLFIPEKILIIFNIVLIVSFILLLSLSGIKRSAYLDKSTIDPQDLIYGNVSIINFDVRIKESSKIFRASDLFQINLNKQSIPNYFIHVGYRYSNLFNIQISVHDIDKIYNDETIEFHYTVSFKKDVYIYFFSIVLSTLFYFIFKKNIKLLAAAAIIKNIKLLLYALIVSVIYISVLVSNVLLGLFKLEFSIYDYIGILLFYLFIYYLSNKNKIITLLSSTLFIVYFFVIQNAFLTYQNTLLSFNNIKLYYTAALVILSKYQQILMVAVTILYSSLTIFSVVYLIIKIYIKFTVRKLAVIILLFVFIYAFNNYSILDLSLGEWGITYKTISNDYGILLSKNFNINYNRKNDNNITKEDVLNAIKIIKDFESRRNIESLLLESTKTSIASTGQVEKRDVYLIFLESFYDYSHFIELWGEDPFDEEYREWSYASQRIGHNMGSGSFYARLSALTGSSPIYPNAIGSYPYFLPYLFKEKGYYTISLEESGDTYNLGNILPALYFDEIIFDIGNANMANYISNAIVDMPNPKFVFAFTFLGHVGGWNNLDNNIKNNIAISDNIKKFISNFENPNIVEETLTLSIAISESIIKMRNIILKNSPNALIIFKHDHLAPRLAEEVKHATIDENIKNSFLNDTRPNPILVWDGTNGAVKISDIVVPENIPLFIAANIGLDYEGTPISLMYKDISENQISTYGNFYDISGNGAIMITNKDSVNKDLLELEEAVDIISKDIFKGKKYTYEYLAES